MPPKRKRPISLNKHGVCSGDDLLIPERKNEKLEEYKATRALGCQYEAEEQAMWEAFTEAFPLPTQ